MLILNSPTEAEAKAPPTGAADMASYPARPLKRCPTHPGAVIADVLNVNGISPRKAAAAIGMSATGLTKVLTEKSPVTPETALRIGTYFGNGPDIWLNLQQAYDLWHAREKLKDELKLIKPVEEKV